MYPFTPLYKTSLTNVLFPVPETAVTIVKVPKGISTDRSFKLFSLAPNTFIKLPFPFLLVYFLLFLYFHPQKILF